MRSAGLNPDSAEAMVPGIEHARDEEGTDYDALPLPRDHERRPWSPNGRREPQPPSGPPEDMRFRDYGVNPWVDSRRDQLSTFAMDVDTGAYTLARRYILDGHLPPIEAVRAEEFVNYFDQGYADDASRWSGEAFSLHLDGAPNPYGEVRGEQLVRVGIQAREVSDRARDPANLTLVIDVSGSMDQDNRLELVKDAVAELLDGLDAEDRVAVVAYSTRAREVHPMASAAEARRIQRAVDRLQPTDSTNAEAGLSLGYDIAEAQYRDGATNRVILFSDGVANVGATGPESILSRVRQSYDQGILLTTIGVGMGTYNDELMEQLADQGEGQYHYVDDLQEARRVLGEQLTGTLQVVAREAKAQVAFNPEAVESYRLIGYENRDVADRDFRNDRVDAGEIGAGHSVTALYAVILRPRAEGELATVQLRYLPPKEGRAREQSAVLDLGDLESRFVAAAPEFRLTASCAAFAEVLRDSPYVRHVDLNVLAGDAEQAADAIGSAEAWELVDLIDRARELGMAYGG